MWYMKCSQLPCLFFFFSLWAFAVKFCPYYDYFLLLPRCSYGPAATNLARQALMLPATSCGKENASELGRKESSTHLNYLLFLFPFFCCLVLFEYAGKCSCGPLCDGSVWDSSSTLELTMPSLHNAFVCIQRILPVTPTHLASLSACCYWHGSCVSCGMLAPSSGFKKLTSLHMGVMASPRCTTLIEWQWWIVVTCQSRVACFHNSQGVKLCASLLQLCIFITSATCEHVCETRSQVVISGNTI